ncbi:hypothetical protein AgCh_013571 [Apium graveolens]
MTGYYHKFVARYAQIAHPFTEQLKKDNYGWTEVATHAFQLLKTALTNSPVLQMPDFQQVFIIEADASGYGVGAVLMQSNRPIAYFSKLLGTKGQQKSIYEKELIVIVLAVQKWKYYLLGRHFVVRSNQQSLRFLTQHREINPEYEKWITKLLGYEFEIQFKPGAANRVADALSRKQEGDKEDNRFSIVENKLLYKGRYVLLKTSQFIPVLMREYHDSLVGGHAGEVKTYLQMAHDWYWNGMRKDIASYVRQCSACQQQKNSQQSPTGLLQPLPIPKLVWEDISMDFIEGLPLSQGFDTIFVVVYRLTKYSHFVGLRHPFDAFSVATVLIREIVRLHGFPASIVSDRDKIFLSTFWKEIFKLQGIELKRGTAYHPQTDGQTELSPFKELYGRDPPHVLRINRGQTLVNSVEEMLRERDAILEDLHFNLVKAQQRMKRSADVQRKKDSFEVNDLKVGSLAYKLDLPESSKVHPILHVSQLKRSVGEVPASPGLPPQLSADLELIVEPEKLLEVRQVQEGRNNRLEALLKWKNLPAYEATWEDMDTTAIQFPDFHLEDKVLETILEVVPEEVTGEEVIGEEVPGGHKSLARDSTLTPSTLQRYGFSLSASPEHDEKDDAKVCLTARIKFVHNNIISNQHSKNSDCTFIDGGNSTQMDSTCYPDCAEVEDNSAKTETTQSDEAVPPEKTWWDIFTGPGDDSGGGGVGGGGSGGDGFGGGYCGGGGDF